MNRAVARPTVVITGGSAGVGLATAAEFAHRRWRVALIARGENGLAAARRQIEEIGAECMTIAADVSDAPSLTAAADEIAAKFGAIDVWINNAMVSVFSPVERITPEEFRRVTEVTYLGYVFGTMAALRHMRPRDSGTIVQVGSALSYRAIPLQSAYCGAKFAIRGFTDSLRSELLHARSRVRLTMVQLPAVNTPQFDWAGNRLGCRLQPVLPVHQPEAVARHIFRAARKAPRELWIGFPAVKAIVAAMLTPGFADRVLADQGYSGQCAPEPVAGDRAGNLFDVPSDGHRMHGRFDAIARTSVRALNPAIGRIIVAALVVALCALVGAGFW
jgi:NAD(P)-dependent dehydrogenase (short-subunit alcohol dehydrogenase family)